MGSYLQEEKESGRVETLPCCRLKEPVEKRVSRFRKERELEMEPGARNSLKYFLRPNL